MSKIFMVLTFLLFFVLVDVYVHQALKNVFERSKKVIRNSVYGAHIAFAVLAVIALFVYHYAIPDLLPNSLRSYIIVVLFIVYLSKLFGVLFLLIDDIRRSALWAYRRLKPAEPSADSRKKNVISRSDFLSRLALISVTVPFATMSYGIVSGAHNYRVRRSTIHLKNLPKAWDGIQVGQISDIHSGSFFDKNAVKKGVDLLQQQKPDIIFFTGDLVNTEAREINNYIDVFSKVKAPLGVYSTLGNHDYGDYKSWPSHADKQKNLENIIKAHKIMGWDILLNEHRVLQTDGEAVGIVGVENWGAGRFSKYGDLTKAYTGTEELPFRILLSHDPSHWDAEVRAGFPDIDLTLSGHTHGFQFGVELGNFKWSPSQYIYEQWAGLYEKKDQYLYVNRGFGFIGYPGRIGILPEITILELKRA
jgi:predicted MPP superfamily phosphohydrolase